MKVSLLVPYRPGDPWRDEVWTWLQTAWREALPDAEICAADGGGSPFSRSASVNAAAAMATGDVFVILDADTWLDPAGIQEAAARIGRRLPWIHKAQKVFLQEPDARALVGRSWRGFPSEILERSPSDRFVIPAPTIVSREAFEAVNGFDERFRGWGCEDNAFVLALQAIAGPAQRQGVGVAVHVWHPSQHIGTWQVWDGQGEARPGLRHLQAYHRAWQHRRDRVRAMRSLVAGNRLRRPQERSGGADVPVTAEIMGAGSVASPGGLPGVPALLHRVWLGRNPVPEPFERWWARFGEINPAWELRTWRDADVPRRFVLRREFLRSRTLAGKADVLRYWILLEHGGVAIDADTEPLRPLADLDLEGMTAFAGLEAEAWVANGFIGASRGHPAIEAVVGALPESQRRQPGVVHQTGPGLLTRTWLGRDDVRLFPPTAFYPVHWTKKDELGGPYPPESFAVQHWAHSWA